MSAGIQLFKRKPGEIFILGNTYLFVLLLATLLSPLVGPAVVGLISPGLGAGIMICGKIAHQGMRVTPIMLFAGFYQNNKKHLQPLLLLGAAHAISFSVVKLISYLILGSEPTIQVDPSGMANTQVPPEVMEYIINSTVLMAVLSLPIVLGFWYAPALVIWHDMSPAKSLFSSWVAMWRNKGAFVTYAAAWLMFSIAVSSVVTFVLWAVGLPSGLIGAMNIMTAALILSVSLATFYPSYRSVFEADPVSTREFIV